jgi:hypothetical protein
MSSESDRRHGNAFTVDFLQRLDEIGEPDGAHEADVAGPWAVRSVLYRGGTGFAVLREWENLAGGAGAGRAGDIPYAVFRRREVALLAAAVLPATGRELLFRLDTEPDADGFPVLASVTASQRRAEPVARSAETLAKTSPTPATQATPAMATVGEGSTAAAAGHLRDFDEGLAFALHLAAALVRSPVALAWLLEAAGHVALEQAGRILDRRIR